MTMKFSKKILSFILSTMLIVAMACSMTGCNGDVMENPQEEQSGVPSEDGKENQSGENQDEEDVTEGTETDSQGGKNVLGEGNTVFTFTVVDASGNEKKYEIHTDKTVVGDALLELELIAGEEGTYGLYVKTVDGIVADFNVNGTYWAFYINGEYAMTGVDATEITAGATYTFKVEK